MAEKSSLEILTQLCCNASMEMTEKLRNTFIQNPTDVLKELAKNKFPFSWEVVNQVFYSEINMASIEVRLYVPGYVLYGRHLFNFNNIEEAKVSHLHALYNAIEPILLDPNMTIIIPASQNKQAPVQQPPVQQQSQTTPLSQEEILNIVQQQAQPQQQNTMINTAEQMKNDTREEIPFDQVNLNEQEMDNLITGNTAQQPTPQQSTNGGGFTQEQIQGMIAFKQKYNIVNDEMLGNYINAWNNKLSKKTDLTPSNVDAFLVWTNSLGNMHN